MANRLLLQAHRVRFLDYTPQSIHCLAFSDDEDLAVARSDGSIEIWSPENHWYQKGVIPGRTNSSIEVLLWCEGNLYSSGLDGRIVQWNTSLLQPQHVTEGNGSAVWCMSFNSSRDKLAAGVENGFIRLYAVQEGGELDFIRAVGPHGSRVLSLSWQPSNQFIFAGGTNSIVKRYEMKRGICDMRITLEKQKEKEIRVWSLVCIDDSHFVSGDSDGKIIIWDSIHGTLVQKFEFHLADILSVVVSSDRKMIFAAGIDQNVICLKKITPNSSEVEWVHSGQVTAHTHDIRAMALSRSNRLVSGGVDTLLVAYNQLDFKKESCEYLYPFPQDSSLYQVAQDRDRLLHQRSTSVDLWQLSSDVTPSSPTTSTRDTHECHPPVHSDPVFLARITLPGSSPSHLTCSTISRDGTHICLSNSSKLWLYRVLTEDASIKLVLSSSIKARHLQFLHSNQIVIATTSGSVLVGDVPTEESVRRDLTVVTLSEATKGVITSLHVSPNNQWIAVVYSHRKIVLFEASKDFSHHQLPSASSPIVSLCFHPHHSYALVLCRNHQLLRINLENQQLTELIAAYNDQENGLPLHWGPVMGSCIVLMGGTESLVIACQDAVLYVRLKDCGLSSNAKGKLKKAGSKRQAAEGEQSWSGLHRNGHLVTKPQSLKLMFLCQLTDSKLVFGEKNWTEISSVFPQPLFRKHYKS